MARRIIQIIPADGWQAQYENGGTIPLVCWALVQDDQDGNIPFVTGIDVAGIGDGEMFDFCDEMKNFSRYIKVP